MVRHKKVPDIIQMFVKLVIEGDFKYDAAESRTPAIEKMMK